MENSSLSPIYYPHRYFQSGRTLTNLSLRTFIELSPPNSEQFDIISLIQFLDCLTQNFVVNEKCIYNNRITISCCHKSNISSEKKVFYISIENNLEKINVYARDVTGVVKLGVFNNKECVVLFPFQISNNTCEFFCKDAWKIQAKFKDSMLYAFANYVARKNTNYPLFLKYSFSFFLSSKTLFRRKISFKGYGNLFEIFNHLPGYVYFELSSQKVGRGIYLKINNKQNVLKDFIWIMPWAFNVISKSQYMQIDASFFALRPYKYCIYHSIYYNASIPIALSINPKENTYLYNLLFKGLSKFNLNKTVFENLYILSDIGSAIKKFCIEHSNHQYFCHRHIIEIFGAKSALGIWAARILKCKTYISFLQEREYILSEIDEYVSLKKLNEKSDKENKKGENENNEKKNDYESSDDEKENDVGNDEYEKDDDEKDEDKEIGGGEDNEEEVKEKGGDEDNEEEAKEEEDLEEEEKKDKKEENKLDFLKLMLLDLNEVELLPDKEKIKKSHFYCGNWAIWIRREHHIPRCSNHSEGFHGIINSKLPKSGKHSIQTSFSIIANFLLNYISSFSENYGNSFKKKHHKFIEKVVKILVTDPESYTKCSSENCDCEESELIKLIYGITFPCIHTVLHDFNESEILKSAKSLLNIDLQSLLILCLDQFPNNLFEEKKFNLLSQIEIYKLIKKFEEKYNKKFNLGGKNVLYWLIHSFLKCFTYNLPQPIQISQNDIRCDNNIKFKTVNRNVIFDKKDLHNSPKNKIKVQKIDDDFDFYIEACDENVKLIRSKYNETKAEIKAMYPKLLLDSVDDICLKCFLRNIYGKKNDDINIVHELATFKINCWKLADEKSGQKRFFG